MDEQKEPKHGWIGFPRHSDSTTLLARGLQLQPGDLGALPGLGLRLLLPRAPGQSEFGAGRRASVAAIAQRSLKMGCSPKSRKQLAGVVLPQLCLANRGVWRGGGVEGHKWFGPCFFKKHVLGFDQFSLRRYRTAPNPSCWTPVAPYVSGLVGPQCSAPAAPAAQNGPSTKANTVAVLRSCASGSDVAVLRLPQNSTTRPNFTKSTLSPSFR